MGAEGFGKIAPDWSRERSMNKFLRFFLLAALGLWLTGCGYSARSMLPARFKTIHILPFKNNIIYSSDVTHNSYVPLLEVKARNAIIDRFLFDGNLKIREKTDADLIMKGELIGFERNVLRTTETNDVQEYRIQVIVSLVLWDVAEEKVMWAEPSFVGETTYFVTGAQAKPENEAVDDAVNDLARRVVERVIEDW